MSRAWQLKSKYGLTLAQYEAMVVKQAGRCAICQDELGEGRKSHVDHDHRSGRVRGILCNNCNGGLGKFRDRIDLLYSAIRYLQVRN